MKHSQLNSGEAAQSARFNREALDYDAQHSDSAALAYRDQFYRNRLCDFDIRDNMALDAMCATGIDTPFLLARGARLQGLDISPICAAIYEERFQLPCTVASICATGFEDRSFDLVYVSGGFHHVSHRLDDAFKEVYRILAPGGRLCFLEPNADSWTDLFRRFWYSRDRKFSSEERALSYNSELKRYLSLGFIEEDYFTGGNIAYLLFQQANVVKTPAFVVRYLNGPLFAAERLINLVPFAPRFFLCARWRKVA